MRAYSLDLRQRVLKDLDSGMKTKAVALKYSVSPAWVRRLQQRRKATGQIGPTPQRYGRIPAWVRYETIIRQVVQELPDATLEEYGQRMGLGISRAALARALNVLGLSRKKRRSGPANKPVRT